MAGGEFTSNLLVRRKGGSPDLVFAVELPGGKLKNLGDAVTKRLFEAGVDEAELRLDPMDQQRDTGVAVTCQHNKGAVQVLAVNGNTIASRPRPAPVPQQQWTSPVAVSGRHPVQAADGFFNPYHFVPAPPRHGSGPLGDSVQLGPDDGERVRHDAYLPGHWSGRVFLTLETITPLLLLDADTSRPARDGHPDHRVFSTRMVAGRPYVAPSGVKGALRSVYEAVTASRLGVFGPHDRPLSVRMEAHDKPKRMVPVRVSDDGNKLQIMAGATRLNAKRGTTTSQHAAWLPYYDRQGRPLAPSLPKHGEEVGAWLELVQHHRWNRKQQRHDLSVRYWRVREVTPAGDPGAEPGPLPHGRKQDGRNWHEVLGESLKHVTGWAVVTGFDFPRKHDERIFFLDPGTAGHPVDVELTMQLRQQWQDVLRGYRAAHTPRELKAPSEAGKPRLARHFNRGVMTEVDVPTGKVPKPGTLCYALYDPGFNVIQGLYPVPIARELLDQAPSDVVDPSVRPARSFDELSPADRVFGWVKPNGSGAHRGLLRPGPVDVCSDDPIEDLTVGGDPDGVPLSILAQPKPQQGPFRLLGPSGEIRGGRSSGYQHGSGQSIGRIVYRPHSTPDGYWDRPNEDRTQAPNGTPAQEYRRPRLDGEDQRDSQNRSITNWIRPGVTMSTWLEITNLSDAELGALLWMLDPGNVPVHRMGSGKPLGFGSIKVSIRDVDVHGGEVLADAYLVLTPSTPPGERGAFDPDRCLQAFQQGLAELVGAGPAKAVLAAVTQLHTPAENVHYPRQTKARDPKGEDFRWWVENQRKAKWGNPPIEQLLPYDPT